MGLGSKVYFFETLNNEGRHNYTTSFYYPFSWAIYRACHEKSITDNFNTEIDQTEGHILWIYETTKTVSTEDGH